MKKTLSFAAILLSLCTVTTFAAQPKVLWNKSSLTAGSLKADLAASSPGEKAVLAYYSDGFLKKVNTQSVAADGTAKLSLEGIDPNVGDKACVYVWNGETLAPLCGEVSEINSEGAYGNLRTLWYSDNQKSNRASSVAYHSFEAQSALYKLELDIAIEKSGDLAVMLGNSSNGNLTYANSAAILLFNKGQFTVKNGNGSGSYTDDGTVLCSASEGKTYHVVFEGNVAENTYTVQITDNETAQVYTSSGLSARKNTDKIDVIGLISNGKNTAVSDGVYSDYCFTGENFAVESVKESVKYSGLAGRYYALELPSSAVYVRGNNGYLTADYKTVKDNSAKFMVRNMGDGSFAFECASSKNRITDSGEEKLRSLGYSMNDTSQHWLLEKSESYTSENQTYYLRNMSTDQYLSLSGKNLAPGLEENKTELRLVGIDDDSKLVQVSEKGCYELLEKAERKRIETLYSSVAGDAFGRYGVDGEWTLRIRIENVFDEILEGDLTDEEGAQKLKGLLYASNNHLFQNSANSGAVSASLPGVDGATAKKGEGTDGSYDFWRGTKLSGTKYPLYIYDKDGNLQQTINLYVHNDSTAKHNADSFCSIVAQIPQPMRKYLKNVKIRNDTANSFNAGGTDLYIRVNWKQTGEQVKSTVFHELGHILDSNAASGWWSNGGGWKAAMEKDMICASEYARSSNAEDFAEFNRLYFGCWGNRDKQIALQIVFPQRYASYYRLRHNVLDGYEIWEDTEYLEQYTQGELQ